MILPLICFRIYLFHFEIARLSISPTLNNVLMRPDQLQDPTLGKNIPAIFDSRCYFALNTLQTSGFD